MAPGRDGRSRATALELTALRLKPCNLKPAALAIKKAAPKPSGRVALGLGMLSVLETIWEHVDTLGTFWERTIWIHLGTSGTCCYS